jgi:hypothetical protein
MVRALKRVAGEPTNANPAFPFPLDFCLRRMRGNFLNPSAFRQHPFLVSAIAHSPFKIN